MINMPTVFKRIFPWLVFATAIILSGYMAFSGQLISKRIIKPLFGTTSGISTPTIGFTRGKLKLSNLEISYKNDPIGSLDSILISPNFKRIFKGHHELITFSGGTLSIGLSELTDLTRLSELAATLAKNPAAFNVQNLDVKIGAEPFTVSGDHQSYLIKNKHGDLIDLKAKENQADFQSQSLTLGYLTLHNINGQINHFPNKFTGTIAGYIRGYNPKLSANFSASPELYEITGQAMSMGEDVVGSVSASFNPKTKEGMSSVKLRGIDLAGVHRLIPWLSQIKDLELKGGSGTFVSNLTVNNATVSGDTYLQWTNGQARLFLYDISNITLRAPIAQLAQSHTFTLTADEIVRHKLKFKEIVMAAGFDLATGILPQTLQTEFCKGHIRLHEFKAVPEGLQATIELKDIDIKELIGLSQITSLSATGTVSGIGTILMTHSKINFLSLEAKSSANKGKIHYFAPDQIRKQDKTSEILSNLNYTELSLSMTAPASDPSESKVQIRIVGSNPQVSDGEVLDFIVDAQGNFGDFF